MWRIPFLAQNQQVKLHFWLPWFLPPSFNSFPILVPETVLLHHIALHIWRTKSEYAFCKLLYWRFLWVTSFCFCRGSGARLDLQLYGKRTDPRCRHSSFAYSTMTITHRVTVWQDMAVPSSLHLMSALDAKTFSCRCCCSLSRWGCAEVDQKLDCNFDDIPTYQWSLMFSHQGVRHLLLPLWSLAGTKEKGQFMQYNKLHKDRKWYSHCKCLDQYLNSTCTWT